MSEQALNPWSPEAAAQREAERLPDRKDPVLFDPMEDAIRRLSFEGSDGETNSGLGVGFFYEDGRKIDIVQPLSGPIKELEIAEGRPVGIRVGPIELETAVKVKRSNGSVEPGWTVAEYTFDKTGNPRAIVTKIENGEKLAKAIELNELMELNGEAGATSSPERAEQLDEVKEEIGEVAVEEVVELNDASVAEAAGRVVEQELQAETKEQKYRRFISEARSELDDLYAEHRQLDPRSFEAGGLENQIKDKKQEIGKYMTELRRLEQASQPYEAPRQFGQ